MHCILANVNHFMDALKNSNISFLEKENSSDISQNMNDKDIRNINNGTRPIG